MALDTTYYENLSHIPLLTIEEERTHLNNLRLFGEISILKREKIEYDIKETLDLDTIFRSLNNNYDEVINNLLSYFKGKTQYKSIYSELVKYKTIADKEGKNLDSTMLKEYFNISSGNTIDQSKLLEEIKKYIIYQNSFDKLYESNLRLVVSIAKKYSNANSDDFFDYIEEGNLGLRLAIQKYDSPETKFSTYASYWIERNIRNYFYSNINHVSNSFKTNYEILKINKKIMKLEQEEGRTLTEEEISEKLNITKDRIRIATCFYTPPKSLQNTIVDSDGDLTLYDTLSDEISTEDIVTEKIISEKINELLRELNEIDRTIIINRYFYLGKYPTTYREISKKVNLTYEGVRYREKNILENFKLNLMKRKTFNNANKKKKKR